METGNTGLTNSGASMVVARNFDKNYIPSVFENQTVNLLVKAKEFGVDDKDSIRKLNADRYMRNLAVLERDGMELSIMPNQTKEMVMTALYQNPKAIQFVIEQDADICNFVLAQNPELIYMFHEQTHDQIVTALMASAMNIKFVKEPTIDHLKMAYDRDVESMGHMKQEWMTDEFVEYAITNFDLSGEPDYYLHRNDKDILRTPLSYITTHTERVVDLALKTSMLYFPTVKLNAVKKKHVINFVNQYPSFYNYISRSLIDTDIKHILLSKGCIEALKYFEKKDIDKDVIIDILRKYPVVTYYNLMNYGEFWSYLGTAQNPDYDRIMEVFSVLDNKVSPAHFSTRLPTHFIKFILDRDPLDLAYMSNVHMSGYTNASKPFRRLRFWLYKLDVIFNSRKK